MHADAELDVEPSCLADLNDDLLRKIASRLAESDLASAVALKRCSSRFKDLATPLVANAVSRINTKWRDAADKIGEEGAARIRGGLERNEVLTDLNLRDNNIRDAGAAAIAEALRGTRRRNVGRVQLLRGNESGGCTAGARGRTPRSPRSSAGTARRHDQWLACCRRARAASPTRRECFEASLLCPRLTPRLCLAGSGQCLP